MKIVVTNNQDFTEDQKRRLESLGEVTYYDSFPTVDEYLERVKDADVICSGTAGLKDAYSQLKNVYITVSFVSTAFVDAEVLKSNNVTLSNAPGANKHAVAEWVIFMMLLMMRQFNEALNRSETYRHDGALPPLMKGLADRNITILGSGNIGRQVGKLAESFDMNVGYFRRGDDLNDSVKNADVIVNTLSSNESTQKILNEDFFRSIKQGSYFIDITRSEIVDEDAMLVALDEGRLHSVATDCGGIPVGDTDDPYYQKLLNHPKIFVTPHISYSTEKSAKTGNDIMIDNVEAWIAGNPQNVVS